LFVDEEVCGFPFHYDHAQKTIKNGNAGKNFEISGPAHFRFLIRLPFDMKTEMMRAGRFPKTRRTR
jgi:hypothetical protein